uniref:Uncharacterized protein n=1 Tax=uncultured marine virus TaxID=186617 RepID=A0A0F7L752_9VIRU|nr:hypothetical protein [uncultured marine virus]
MAYIEFSAVNPTRLHNTDGKVNSMAPKRHPPNLTAYSAAVTERHQCYVFTGRQRSECYLYIVSGPRSEICISRVVGD